MLIYVPMVQVAYLNYFYQGGKYDSPRALNNGMSNALHAVY